MVAARSSGGLAGLTIPTDPIPIPTEPQRLSVAHADRRINIWEGSIRSGKTVASVIAWLAYVAAAPPGATGRVYGTVYAGLDTGLALAAPAFGLLMALVVSALVINWAMISLAHMKFRKAKQQQGVTTRFPALLYPLGNWVCLIFMAAVLVIMLMTPGMAISVYLIPVWIAILGIGYLFKQKTAGTVKAH